MHTYSHIWTAIMHLLEPAAGSEPRGARGAAQGLVEYAIVLALVAIIALASLQQFGGGVGALFTRLLGRISGLG